MNTFDLKIGKVKAEFRIEFYHKGWSIHLIDSELDYHSEGAICAGVIDNNKIYCLEIAPEFYFFKSEFLQEIKKYKIFESIKK